MKTEIVLAGGKYTVLHEEGANLRALRYGEPWRELVGDGLVLAMAQRIEELEAPKPAEFALTMSGGGGGSGADWKLSADGRGSPLVGSASYTLGGGSNTLPPIGGRGSLPVEDLGGRGTSGTGGGGTPGTPGKPAPTLHWPTEPAAPAACEPVYFVRNKAFKGQWLESSSKGAHDRMVEMGAYDSRVLYAAPQPAFVLPEEALRDAVREALCGLYACTRVWSAWGEGTMGQDDFFPAEDEEECVTNVVDAVRKVLKGAPK